MLSRFLMMRELAIQPRGPMYFHNNIVQLLRHKRLDLSNSQITENGIYTLAKSVYSVNIEEIDLSRNYQNVTDLSLMYIADSHYFKNLSILILTGSKHYQYQQILQYLIRVLIACVSPTTMISRCWALESCSDRLKLAQLRVLSKQNS